LESIGVPVPSIDVDTFQLFNQGQEVALYLGADFLLFYGQRIDSKYTDKNIYWLDWGVENGARMLELYDPPDGGGIIPSDFWTSIHLEEDHHYRPVVPNGAEKDRWYWDYLPNTTPTGTQVISRTYETYLSNIATTPFSVTITGAIRAYRTTYPHHTVIYLNDQVIDDDDWQWISDYYIDIDDVDSSLLNEGLNSITVEAPDINGSPQDTFYINWLEILYSHTYSVENDLLYFNNVITGTLEYHINGFSNSEIEAFDITDPISPIKITNGSVNPNGGNFVYQFEHEVSSQHRYIAQTEAQRLSPPNISWYDPAGLNDPSIEADYIIISHPDFLSPIQDLADFRESQGYLVEVVDIVDIFYDFSYGIYTPEAIHNFLDYAYDNWKINDVEPPLYVLLVGDGNIDFKNNLGTGELNFIPIAFTELDLSMGETATDNYFVSVNGDDFLPDMHIGRLAAQTSQETSDVVAKILAYEQNPPIEPWNRNITFIADNPDSAWKFDELSDAIADHFVPGIYNVEKIYYGVTHPNVGDARSAIIQAFNEGRLIINYIGHSAIQEWAYPVLFGINSFNSLDNDHFPFMVPMTCLEGYFIYPGYQALGESIVNVADKGAVASWSSTGTSVAYGHDVLAQGLYEGIFNLGIKRIGPATTYAKIFLYTQTGSFQNIIETYVLFGDPASELPLTYGIYLPLVENESSE